MALLLTLFLTCVFVSKALTLQCYGCVGGPCGQTVVCSSYCGSMTTTAYLDGKTLNSYSKMNCGDRSSCVSGSINAGQSKVTINSQCCNNTNYCASQAMPDLPRLNPNAKQCFTCNMTDCSKTLACEGDETQCFSATVDVNGKKVLMKGCASKQLCAINGTQILGLPAPLGAAVAKCCEGNLCNGAQSLGVYFPILIALLSLLCSDFCLSLVSSNVQAKKKSK